MKRESLHTLLGKVIVSFVILFNLLNNTNINIYIILTLAAIISITFGVLSYYYRTYGIIENKLYINGIVFKKIINIDDITSVEEALNHNNGRSSRRYKILIIKTKNSSSLLYLKQAEAKILMQELEPINKEKNINSYNKIDQLKNIRYLKTSKDDFYFAINNTLYYFSFFYILFLCFILFIAFYNNITIDYLATIFMPMIIIPILFVYYYNLSLKKNLSFSDDGVYIGGINYTNTASNSNNKLYYSTNKFINNNYIVDIKIKQKFLDKKFNRCTVYIVVNDFAFAHKEIAIPSCKITNVKF